MRAARSYFMALLALMILPTLTLASGDFKTETALTRDASAHYHILHANYDVEDKIGIGGNLGFEVRPWEHAAIGVQYAHRHFFGDYSWDIGSADLNVKLFPWGRGEKGEMYLEGGFGALVPADNDVDQQDSRGHAFAGAGYRFMPQASKHVFYDLGLVYDQYTPRNRFTGLLGVKFGIGWTFGSNRQGGAPKKQETVKASTNVSAKDTSDDSMVDANAAQTKRSVEAKDMDNVMDGDADADVSSLKGHRVMLYKVEKGDCLWSISEKEEIYDDGTKWPRIYKANRDQIKDPNLIYPRQKLKIVDPNKPLRTTEE